ncbi:MAG: hypothetical protein Q9M50_03540 [Methylococcales bacterium]|nr:hypothetical protein [Methylococcales bacterium]
MKTSTQSSYKLLTALALILTSINTPAYAADESNVLSVVTGDWNQDKKTDAAVLMKNDDLVEIYIFLGQQNNTLKQVLYKSDFIWMGSMEGTVPYLESKGKKGSFIIMSGNDSIGRNRWSQALTIAYREKAFTLGGYTYNSRDTLAPDHSFACDLNLFTGKGLRNNKAFKINAQKIKLKDWSDDNVPTKCQE